MARFTHGPFFFALCGAFAAIAFPACGGGTSGVAVDGGSTPQEASSGDDAGSSADGPTTSDGPATPEATTEAGSAPRNASCTPLSQQTGTIVNSKHGRLDGKLVYVLPVNGSHSCNGDSSHVHLQVEVSGLVYDVAVDVGTSTTDEVGMLVTSETVPGGVWSEGWHSADNLSYPSLGVHSTQLTLADPGTIASQIESALGPTGQIAIFCTGYTQGNGCHDVHYQNGSGQDGAIVLDPASATSPMMFLRFQADSF